MTWPEMKNAPRVVTAHAASEMMRARRSASRCSITDIRCSSTGSEGRRPRWRTLSRRATRRTSGLRGGGLGLRARGGGALRSSWRSRRRSRLHGARDLVRQLRGRLSKLAHGLADSAPKLGQPARPKDDEHDDQQADDVKPVQLHRPDYRPGLAGPTSKDGQVTVIEIEMILSLGVTAWTFSIPLTTVPKRL